MQPLIPRILPPDWDSLVLDISDSATEKWSVGDWCLATTLTRDIDGFVHYAEMAPDEIQTTLAKVWKIVSAGFDIQWKLLETYITEKGLAKLVEEIPPGEVGKDALSRYLAAKKVQLAWRKTYGEEEGPRAEYGQIAKEHAESHPLDLPYDKAVWIKDNEEETKELQAFVKKARCYATIRAEERAAPAAEEGPAEEIADGIRGLQSKLETTIKHRWLSNEEIDEYASELRDHCIAYIGWGRDEIGMSLSNGVTAWVEHLVLTEAEQTKRILAVENLLRLARECAADGNFFGAWTVYGACAMHSIERLKELGDNDDKNILSRLFYPAWDFENYREHYDAERSERQGDDSPLLPILFVRGHASYSAIQSICQTLQPEATKTKLKVPGGWSQEEAYSHSYEIVPEPQPTAD